MSYDIELVDPVTLEPLELDSPHHMRGGTYAVGGSTRARLNVTYNYAPHFSKSLSHWPGHALRLLGVIPLQAR